MGFNFEGNYSIHNGAKGLIPVTPAEWRMVGLDSDVRAYNLLNYCYRSSTTNLVHNQLTVLQNQTLPPFKNKKQTLLLQNLMDVFKPSTMQHLAEKYIQLAASNQQGGGSFNLPTKTGQPGICTGTYGNRRSTWLPKGSRNPALLLSTLVEYSRWTSCAS